MRALREAKLSDDLLPVATPYTFEEMTTRAIRCEPVPVGKRRRIAKPATRRQADCPCTFNEMMPREIEVEG